MDFFNPLHSDLEWPSVPDLRLISFVPNEKENESTLFSKCPVSSGSRKRGENVDLFLEKRQGD